MGQDVSEDNNKEYHLFIIDALIQAKKKEKKAEKQMYRAAIIFFIVLTLGAIYIFLRLSQAGPGSSYLTFLLDDGLLLIWIAALFLCFYNFNNKARYFDKKEKDFEELKEDVIDRADDIWHSPSGSRNRLREYHELNDKYDINLFHK
jgi:hypothetical protein